MTTAWETPPTGPSSAVAAAAGAALTRLRTARLDLRPAAIADFPLFAGIVAAADGADPGDLEQRKHSWRDFAQMVAGWLLRGHGLFAIDRRADGVAIGFIPLDHECGDPEREIGWFLTSSATGQGFATEAASAVRNHAYATLGWTTLVSYIAPDNLRSRAVAERLGATCECAVQDGCLVYRHPAPGVRA